MKTNLQNIKVGDRVWVSGRHNKELFPVGRLTPSQIVLSGPYGEKRFQRGKPPRFPHVDSKPTYHRIGYAGWDLLEIIGIATEDECAKWDAEQEQKREETEAAKQKAEARSALQEELLALLPESYYVQDTHNNLAGEWQVYTYCSTSQVRELAERLRQ